MSRWKVFAIRAVAGLAGGWLLKWLFFPQEGWIVALSLAVIVVAAAYASEAWRGRG